MKALIQRVKEASVETGGMKISQIGPGLLIFLGVIDTDTPEDLEYLARKCVNLRIFDDSDNIPNLSVADTGGDMLIVSQFTLAASTRKGNRPSYIKAARPEIAENFYNRFCDLCSKLLGKEVQRGKFRSDMNVSLINSGPMTIILDSKDRVTK